MYRRIFLTALLGLTLSACVPYYDGGQSYYRSEVYTSPAPAYYYGGAPAYRRGYYAPPPRYYSAPRYYQPGPRYYPAGPRAGYHGYPNQRGRDHWGNGGRGRGDGRGGDHGRGRGGHR
ncbi:hypothetical protein GIR22_16845 [Pseudomonas sp. CCM 7891]|uniref:Lipoprotein n=1 Tax=Pseudomonas karstica TaxID=1055468 RepID=A0A7X2RVQ7_9PSED|nr:hypothetical protein [Pseudomonas karstica]MTD20797.1 hypothetical protein [Pseudomonas karstica]